MQIPRFSGSLLDAIQQNPVPAMWWPGADVPFEGYLSIFAAVPLFMDIFDIKLSHFGHKVRCVARPA